MTHFTLDQIRALWRAFVSIGTVGTTGSIVGNEETPFNQALDDEWRLLQITFIKNEWRPLQITYGKTRQDRKDHDDVEPFFLPSMFAPKPKTVARDPKARAQRVVETLLQDPELAILVWSMLGAHRVAQPWHKNYANIWDRGILGSERTACYMKNQGTTDQPFWQLIVEEREGEYTHVDSTEDVEAGKAALDVFLSNTGWILQ